MTRIAVIGVTSTGKSTLGETLSRVYSCRFIESDAVLWRPNWQKSLTYVEDITKYTEDDSWVIASHNRAVRDVVFSRADTVIWLDYPFWTILWRLIRRTIRRWWTQELLWGTNRETMWMQFKLWSEDSLLYCLFKTYWRRKKEYPISLASYPHLRVLHFRTPEETQTWLESVQAASKSE